MRVFTIMLALVFLLLAGCTAPPAGAPTATSVPTAILQPTIAQSTATAAPTVVPTVTAPATETVAPTFVPMTVTQPAGTTVPTLASTAAPSTTVEIPKSTPAAVGQDCGMIQMLGPNPPRDQTALQSEQCFWQAYQQCTVATLTVAMRGVDAGTIHQFTLSKSGSGCTITDTAQPYVVPHPTPAATRYTCASLKQQADGLLFTACGDEGDITVPAPQP